MSSKRCTLCGKIKPLSAFGKHSITKDGLSHWCKQCNNERSKKFRETPVGIYTNLKGQAKFFGRPLVEMVSKKNFIKWYAKQPKVCVYCGIKEEDLGKTDDLFNATTSRLSIDRMDNEKGYVLDNMVLACRRCNYMKSNFFSFDEMKNVGENHVRPKWEKAIKNRHQRR